MSGLIGTMYTHKSEQWKDKRSGFGTMYDEQGSWSNDIPDDTYKRKNEMKIQKPKSHKSTKKRRKSY